VNARFDYPARFARLIRFADFSEEVL